MKSISSLVIVIVLAALLAACGGGGESSDSGPESITLDVVMNDIYYGDSPTNADDPPTWTVSAGAEVTVNLQNNGALEHNWAIVKPGSEVPIPFIEADHADIIQYDTGLNAAAETSTVVISDPLQPGEYQIICTVAGHYPGMQGRLVVTE